MKKVRTKKIEEVIVGDNGAVTLRHGFERSAVPSEPPYVKVFCQDISKLHNLPKQVCNVLWALFRRMQYDNTVLLPNAEKRAICEEIGLYKRGLNESEVSVNSLDIYLNKMARKGMITRVGTGKYIMNPFLFGKGGWTNINNIRLSSIYCADGTITYVDTITDEQKMEEIKRLEERLKGDES